LLPSLASRISSIRLAARSLPSALVSTERMYSSDPSETAMNWSASWRNSSSAALTSSRVTCLSDAMAEPSSWTSRAVRYLKTSAAASSPRDIMSRAARVKPLCWLAGLLLSIFLYPRADDHGDGARILLRHLARGFEVFLVTGALGGALLRGRLALGFFFGLGQ